MWSAHLVPPFFVHCSTAFCWASCGSVEVAQPVKPRSAASAPHCLLKAIRKTHALPRWEQVLMASFSALAWSLFPCDHPAPMSAALYAIAPQDIARGCAGGFGLFDPLVPVSEHVERGLRQVLQCCWQTAVALAAASFSVLPVATSKCREPLASAMAAHVFWNRYTTLQSLPYLLHAAMASWPAAPVLVLF
jgi:hypothetical protein